MHTSTHWPVLHKTLFVLLFIVLLITLFWATALSQQAGESVQITEASESDVYLAGQLVRISAEVDGDVTAAGREIALEADISGDLIAAGERIDVAGNVGDDVRAAGRRIEVRSSVAGHIVAAGAEVTISKNARVGDWAWLAGQRIDVRGDILGELRAAGETVVISGTVAGNAEVMADEFRLEPGAVIEGDLIWRGRSEPEISADANLGGELIRKPVAEHRDDGASIFGALFIVVSLTLLALAIGLLFPEFGAQLGDIARQRPWMAFGVAVIVLLLTPALVALCFATAVGFMIGITLLLLFLAVVLTGTAMGMLAIAHAGAAKVNKPVTSWGTLLRALLVVALVIWVASWLPVLGGLVFLVVWLLGIGTAELAGYRRVYSR